MDLDDVLKISDDIGTDIMMMGRTETPLEEVQSNKP